MSHDHRSARVGGDGGDQRIESANSGVAVARALFVVSVDFDDRIVDVDQDSFGVDAGDHRGPRGQAPSRREATASSWRMCPKVSSRRNDPKVEGA